MKVFKIGTGFYSYACPAWAGKDTIPAPVNATKPNPPGTWCAFNMVWNDTYFRRHPPTPVEVWVPCKSPQLGCWQQMGTSKQYPEDADLICPVYVGPDQLPPPNGFWESLSSAVHLTTKIPSGDVTAGTVVPLIITSINAPSVAYTLSWSGAGGSGSKTVAASSSGVAVVKMKVTATMTFRVSFAGGLFRLHGHHVQDHFAASTSKPVRFRVVKHLPAGVRSIIGGRHQVTGTTTGNSPQTVTLQRAGHGTWTTVGTEPIGGTHRFRFSRLAAGTFRVLLGGRHSRAVHVG